MRTRLALAGAVLGIALVPLARRLYDRVPVMACTSCGDPIDLTTPHRVVNHHIERLNRRGTRVTVLDANLIEWRHLRCTVPEDVAENLK